jgi:hypothetical protein
MSVGTATLHRPDDDASSNSPGLYSPEIGYLRGDRLARQVVADLGSADDTTQRPAVFS